MRKCLRYNALMVENLHVMASNGEGGVDVREKGIFKNALAKIKLSGLPRMRLRVNLRR